MTEKRRLYLGVLRIKHWKRSDLPPVYCWQPIHDIEKEFWETLDFRVAKKLESFLGKSLLEVTGNYTVPVEVLREMINDGTADDYQEVIVVFERYSLAVSSLPLVGEPVEVFISSREGGLRYGALVKTIYHLRDGSGVAVILDIDEKRLPNYLGYGRRYGSFVLKHNSEWCVLMDDDCVKVLVPERDFEDVWEYVEVTDLDIMIMSHESLVK